MNRAKSKCWSDASSAGIKRAQGRPAFERLGWQVARQRASHIIMVKEGEFTTLSIPDNKKVAKGTLRSLIGAAGITVDEFTRQL